LSLAALSAGLVAVIAAISDNCYPFSGIKAVRAARASRGENRSASMGDGFEREEEGGS
jgi:hypothetical protein